jgi:hypothetical protein
VSTTEQERTTRKITIKIGLDHDYTLEEYARILVAISAIPVDSIGGDPGVDFTDQPS